MTGRKFTVHPIEKPRSDRLIDEIEHDPYHVEHKLSEPTRCPVCGAVFHHGHWVWDEAPAEADEALCPACLRVRDRVPAGILTVSGEFFRDHRDEILHLIHNTVEHENAEHPLKRLMGTEEAPGQVVFTFTDPHLVRGIGHALHSAYKGELHFQYQDGDVMLRATWTR